MKPETFLENAYHSYFNGSGTSINILDSLANIPEAPLQQLAAAIQKMPLNGRVFFFGNGGSFDNARFLSSTLQQLGVKSSVPAIEGSYTEVALKLGYSEIYCEGLKLDSLQPGDIAVGISGSGNSGNVNRALELAKQQGVTTFCLGGRDGGRMVAICGVGNSVIVPNDSMEAIEDLHLACGLLLRDVLSGEKSISASKKSLVEKASEFFRKNITAFPSLAAAIVKTIDEGSRFFIVGHSIAANHFRADMMRGATAKIPFRGIVAPELFSVNSFQATANDDGISYASVRGLLKHEPRPEDFSLLLSLPSDKEALELCEVELREAGVPFMRAGFCNFDENDLVLSDFADDIELGFSLLGHSTSVAINSLLTFLWDVQPLKVQLPQEFQGKKKLNRQETLALEKHLLSEKTLEKGRIISFCYGKVYSARIPAGFKGKRFFY